jgi:hypothetical protein
MMRIKSRKQGGEGEAGNIDEKKEQETGGEGEAENSNEKKEQEQRGEVEAGNSDEKKNQETVMRRKSRKKGSRGRGRKQ